MWFFLRIVHVCKKLFYSIQSQRYLKFTCDNHIVNPNLWFNMEKADLHVRNSYLESHKAGKVERKRKESFYGKFEPVQISSNEELQ